MMAHRLERGTPTYARRRWRTTCSTIPSSCVVGVQRDPAAALRAGAALLDADPSPRHRALALWTVGMAHRELGELRARPRPSSTGRGSWRSSSTTRRWPARSPSRCRWSWPSRASWATRSAILDVSEPGLADGACSDACARQRGVILYQQGDFAAALVEYEAALHAARRRSGDLLGELRQRIEHRRPAQLPRPARRRPRPPRAGRRSRPRSSTRRCCRRWPSRTWPTSGRSAGDFPAAFESFERARGVLPQLRLRRPDGAVAAARPRPRAARRPTCWTRRASWPTGRSPSPTRPRASSIWPRACSSPPRPTSQRGDAAGGDRRRRAQRRRVRRPRAARRGRRWPGRCCCGRGRPRGRRPSWPTRWPPTPSTLDALGCRTDAVRANLLAAELRVELGDLDGADAAAALARPAPCARPSSTSRRRSRVRALIESARGNRAGARRAVNLGVRLLADHQAVLGATRAARLRRGQQRRAGPHRRPAGDRGRPPAGAARPARSDPPHVLAAARPPVRPTTTCSPSCSPGCGSSSSQQRDAVADAAIAGPSSTQERVVLERPHPQPRPPGAGRGHPGRRPARGSRCGCSASAPSSSTPTSTARCSPCRSIGNRASLHELGPVDGLAGDDRQLRPQPPPAQPGPGLGGLARAGGGDPLGAVGASLAERLLPAAGPALGSSRRHRARRGCCTVCRGGALPGTARAAGLGHAVADGVGDRPPARRAGRRVALVAGPGLAHADAEVAALAELHDHAAEILVGADADVGPLPRRARRQRPRPHRLSRLVPPRQPAVLDAAAGRRRARRSSTWSDARRCRGRSCSRRATWRWGRR